MIHGLQLPPKEWSRGEIEDIVKGYIKENLTIKVSTDSYYCWGDARYRTTVQLKVGDEVIAEAEDYFTLD